MRWGYGFGYSIYRQLMLWSCNLDYEGKIWKYTKKAEKTQMNLIKILNFIDGIFPEEKFELKLGTLYKIKGEDLPFRYIQYSKYKNNDLFYFKHHQLKEYVFNDLSMIERQANQKEINIYNKIKNHINSISKKIL